MAITDNLMGYWDLSEASGTRADGLGVSSLADNNSVTGSTGPGSHNASVFNGTTQFLSHASNSNIIAPASGGSMTISAWVYLSSFTGDQIIVGKDINTPANSRDYTLLAQTDIVRFYTGGGANVQTVDSATHFSAINTWHFVVAWRDFATLRMKVCINDGTVTSSSADYVGPFDSSTSSSLNIGRREYSGFNGYFGGRIAMVGMWSRVLTSGEITTLYNSGSGLSYAELSPVTDLPEPLSDDNSANWSEASPLNMSYNSKIIDDLDHTVYVFFGDW